MSVSMTEASVAHATHSTTESRSNNQPSVSPSFFPFLEWLVLKRYGTIGGQRPRWHEGASGRARCHHASAPRTRPVADDDARAWNPGVTSQRCRPSTQTSLGERSLIKCPLLARFADSSRTSREVREVPKA